MNAHRLRDVINELWQLADKYDQQSREDKISDLHCSELRGQRDAYAHAAHLLSAAVDPTRIQDIA